MIVQCKRPSRLPRTGAYYYWRPARSRERAQEVGFYFQLVSVKNKREPTFLFARVYDTDEIIRVPKDAKVTFFVEDIRLSKWINFGHWSKRIGSDPTPVSECEMVTIGLQAIHIHIWGA